VGDADRNPKPLPRVEIRVTNPGQCPVLAAGGRMVYAHPEVVKEDSDRICAQALGGLASAAEEVARTAAAGRRTPPFELRCPVDGCGARFELHVMPTAATGDEVRRSQARPSTSSGRAGREPVERQARRADFDEPGRAAEPVGGDAEAPAPPSTGSGHADRELVERPAPRETEAVAPPPAARSPISPMRTSTTRIKAGVVTAPFLSRLEPAVVREIVEASTVRRFAEPAVFIQEGQEGEAFYIVGDGEVEVVRQSDDGHEVVLATVGKGHCLGEMSLVTGQPASATVRTRGRDVAVLVLPGETFQQLLRRRPTLHREFSRIIAERLYSMNVKLETQTSRGITGRLSMIGVVDVVQTLHASRRTGTLVLQDESGREAQVGFREGEVVSAVAGEMRGPEGFYELVTWREGDFSFEGGEPQPDPAGEAAVSGGTMALLMEGMRRMDEKGAGE
jgi:CRP-like cAMP-binding protein